jgi:hypothetical protein
MATPFVATFKFRGQNGKTFQRTATGTDATTVLLVWQDGGTVLQLPNDCGGIYLDDVVIPQAATMTRIQVSANSLLVGEAQITPQANLGTNTYRQFMGSPVGFKPGAALSMTQLT